MTLKSQEPLNLSQPSYRLEYQFPADMVYIHYNLWVWTKQIEHPLDGDAISLKIVETFTERRVESKIPIIEEAPHG